MGDAVFIPHSVMGLYEKMVYEQFMGEVSREEDQLVWRLPNGIIVKAAPDDQYPEWYIATSYLDCGREIPLTHWHPAEEDVYRDLYGINTGQIFWVVRKKSFFSKKAPMIMEREEWQKYSDRHKSRYIVL